MRKLDSDTGAVALEHIAQSLAHHYASIYYIDMLDDSYVEFASSDVYKDLDIAPEGSDFFAETRRNNMRLVHPDDIDLLEVVCNKEALLQHVADGHSFTVTYRLLMDQGPMYAQLSAMMADDGRHVIVGVSDVDEQVRNERAAREAEARHATYTHIAQSLARLYANIFYVDAQTRAYTEFASTGLYHELGIPASGDDFLAELRGAVERKVHPDDASQVLAAMAPDALKRQLDRNGHVSVNCRLMLASGLTYANLRAMWADDRRHLIVGLSDVDDQVKAELAARDAEE